MPSRWDAGGLAERWDAIVTECPELVHVPSVQELVVLRLAKSIHSNSKGVTFADVSPEGHALMGAAMRENGRRLREWDESKPSRAVPVVDRPILEDAADGYPAWE